MDIRNLTIIVECKTCKVKRSIKVEELKEPQKWYFPFIALPPLQCLECGFAVTYEAKKKG
jgi:hypothetical protein